MRSPLSPFDFLGMPLLIGLGILALVSCSGGHRVAALVQPLTTWLV
ncbi:hypothetical protein [Pseudomonas oryzihabitans]|nr:hypothetical protein [Pseudomonas oryzihabitans]MDT3718778.1 hypothetical protein [Pseudomonas oryzihabitans]